MQPRNGFVCVEHDVGEPDRAVWKVSGVDVGAVAFIPPLSRETLPPCGLSELEADLHRGVDALLAEGTSAPPASFEGPEHFMRFLRERRHRGALALVEPTAYLDRDERVVRVELRLTSARVGAGFVHRSSGVTWGIGAATDKRRVELTVAERHVRIDAWQRFALPFADEPEGRFPGADMMPLGWLRFVYFLHVDGTSQAWCASSYLPSAWFYRDYVRTHRRALEQASAVEAEAVLRPTSGEPTGTSWACLDTSTGCIHLVA